MTKYLSLSEEIEIFFLFLSPFECSSTRGLPVSLGTTLLFRSPDSLLRTDTVLHNTTSPRLLRRRRSQHFLAFVLCYPDM